MKFEKGNPGGPGRPRKSVEERYQKAVYSAVNPAQLKKIVEKLADKAERGDIPAAKLLLGYLLGLPVGTTQLTGNNGEPLKVIFEHSQNTDTEVSQGPTGDR